MTPAARFQTAAELLDAWNQGAPIEKLLTAWARRARYAGAKDRRNLRDLVYTILRQRGSLADLAGGATGRHLILGLARRQGLDPDAVFSGARYAPAALSTAERARFQTPISPDPERDLPAWLLDALHRSLGADLPVIAAAFADRAPVYLRVNLAKCTALQAIDMLHQDGIVALPDERARAALVLDGATGALRTSHAYRSGLVEPQDLSVQMAVEAVEWPGPVLDYCAGGGGKALAIAALTGAAVDVHDADPARMADIPVRARRADADLRQIAKPGHKYMRVLTDVPCSGSGTWRRDPEAKWRLTQAALSSLMAQQAQILDRAAAFVAPGGRLIYMTCSLLRGENEEQVVGFLARNAGWHCHQHQQFTPLSASDGFFFAEMEKLSTN
ncbi:MAG: RsmB/NOP family class I SAM-dependent RNA methyltransferase [Pseudomonadota bacterium]